MGWETVLLAASAAQSAGSLIQGYQQSQALEYDADVKRQQARIEQQQAVAREEQQRRQASQVLGKQRAAIAQSGIGSGGSALDIYEQSKTMAELDALTIRYEGDMRAKGLLAQADAAQTQAKQAMVGGVVGAGASALSGYGTYSYYKGGGLLKTPSTAPG